MNDPAPNVQMILIAEINVLNPRSRNKIVFQNIVSNISNLGLKKPITVARRPQSTDGRESSRPVSALPECAPSRFLCLRHRSHSLRWSQVSGYRISEPWR
jgi:hypothetical protein